MNNFGFSVKFKSETLLQQELYILWSIDRLGLKLYEKYSYQ